MSEDEGLSSRVRDASERMALAEPEKIRRLQPAETSSSPSSSTPPTATSATVTTATVPVLTRTGVKRAAEDPPDDTGSRDSQDDDDTAMDEFCVLERFDKLKDQAARNRTSIEEPEMKLKEDPFVKVKDIVYALITLDARLVEHVEQLTRIVTSDCLVVALTLSGVNVVGLGRRTKNRIEMLPQAAPDGSNARC